MYNWCVMLLLLLSSNMLYFLQSGYMNVLFIFLKFNSKTFNLIKYVVFASSKNSTVLIKSKKHEFNFKMRFSQNSVTFL